MPDANHNVKHQILVFLVSIDGQPIAAMPAFGGEQLP